MDIDTVDLYNVTPPPEPTPPPETAQKENPPERAEQQENTDQGGKGSAPTAEGTAQNVDLMA